MSKTTFFEVTISRVPSEIEDEISYFCIENGAQGVSQKLDFVQKDLRYDPEVLPKNELTLSAFYDAAPAADILEQLKLEFPQVDVVVTEKPSEDWMEEWKKHFTSFSLVGDFWVVPSWLEVPKEAKHALRIDPGMAFGTGTHATTQIAAKLLVEFQKHFNNGTVLDVGTGTGILAMLASHLGAQSVEATEIDVMARETGEKNIEINQPNCVHMLQIQIEEIKKQYDFVVANIIDGVLLQLKPELLRVLKPNGVLVLTGILDDRKPWFVSSFLENTKLKVLTEVQKDEWWGVVLQ